MFYFKHLVMTVIGNIFPFDRTNGAIGRRWAMLGSKSIGSEFKTIVLKSETVVSKFKTIVSKSETIVSKFKTTVSKSETVVSKFKTIVSKSETIVSKFKTVVLKSETRGEMGYKRVSFYILNNLLSIN
jgi:hypothetical protein